MLYNKGNHAQLKRVQPQPSRLQGENGGKIYSTWNPGKRKKWSFGLAMPITNIESKHPLLFLVFGKENDRE